MCLFEARSRANGQGLPGTRASACRRAPTVHSALPIASPPQQMSGVETPRRRPRSPGGVSAGLPPSFLGSWCGEPGLPYRIEVFHLGALVEGRNARVEQG